MFQIALAFQIMIQDMIAKLLVAVLFAANEINSACNSASYVATSQLQTIYYYHYSNDENCTIHIQPHILHRYGYYLELKWIYFDIEGNLPQCKDHVEVFLTKYNKTIGKYCSGNIASSKLFNMYSVDGYASIRFTSDGNTTKGGFSFTFQLRSIYSNPVGQYGSAMCYYTMETSYYGIFYSSGWPRGYTKGIGYCHLAITAAKLMNLRILVMDLDLRDATPICDAKNDYFSIAASQAYYTDFASIMLHSKSVSQRHCGAYHPGYFTLNGSNVYYIIINKPVGSYPSYPNSGFMMAYMLYDTGEEPNDTAKTAYINLGAVVGGSAALFFVIYTSIRLSVVYGGACRDP